VFTTVPPGPGQFDRIYCTDVLEHVEDDSGLIGELVSYLASGGSVVGTTLVEGGAYEEALLRRALAPWGRVRLHRYYRSALRNLLPVRQQGDAVLVFQVTPPSPPGAR
jgi:2-polyprenyl-3-methyl-5-hydroxy-6-metoxy-1,4-benzoquinol methylase